MASFLKAFGGVRTWPGPNRLPQNYVTVWIAIKIGEPEMRSTPPVLT